MRIRRAGWLVALLAPLVVLYGVTLLPGVGGGDTAEFQRVGPTLGVAHSTGYPLYVAVGWLWSKLLILGTPAWRMNMLSLVCGVGTLALAAAVLRALDVRRWAVVGGLLVLGLTSTYWQASTHAEIYAPALLLLAGHAWALVRYQGGQAPLWQLGLSAGLLLAHHRTSAIILVASAGLVLAHRPWPRTRAWLVALVAGVLPLASYLLIPLRSPPWVDGWVLLGEYLTGAAGTDWLQPGAFLARPLARLSEVAGPLILDEWTLPGVTLGLLGAWELWRRRRLLGVWAGAAYVGIVLFACVYMVPDLAVFVLPAHLIHGLWLGCGLERLAVWAGAVRWRRVGLLAGVGAIAWLIAGPSLAVVRATNTDAAERLGRERLGGPLAEGALLFGDDFGIETMRYLQTVEGIRQDIELGFEAQPARIAAALAASRAVYLTAPSATLPYQQQFVAGLWEVRDAPLAISEDRRIVWAGGLEVTGLAFEAAAVRPGASVLLTLRWRAEQAPPGEILRFIHVIDGAGRIVAQDDAAPTGLAPQHWGDEERYDLIALQLPTELAAGDYQLKVGLYTYPELTALPLANGAEAALLLDFSVGK